MALCSSQQLGKQESTVGQWSVEGSQLRGVMIAQSARRQAGGGDGTVTEQGESVRISPQSREVRGPLVYFSNANHSDLRGFRMLWEILAGGSHQRLASLRKGAKMFKGFGLLWTNVVIFHSLSLGSGFVQPSK